MSWLINMIMIMILPLATGRSSSPNMSLPNCPDSCGNVTIPYPFGIGTGCYHDQWFAITCKNNTTNVSTKPYLTAFNLEFVTVDLEGRLLTLNVPNGASNSKCPGQTTSTVWKSTNFTGSPFIVSRNYNHFTVVGCDNALLSYAGKTIAGCTSACIDNNDSSTTDNSCYGIGCCQTTIRADLDYYQVTISGNNNGRNCTYAFIAQSGWYPSNVSNNNLDQINHVPIVLDWRPKDTIIFMRGSYRTPRFDCFSPTEGGAIRCDCGWAYEGNPFITNGCKVVEACAGCEKDCDRRSIGGEFYCNPDNTTEIIIGASLGGTISLLLLCGSTIWLYKYIKTKRIIQRKKTFFKRNGGLLLQQKISSDQGIVESTMVFDSHALEKATDNFNEDRILGRGGQGTVYKGMLTDGKIVAIKKAKVDETQLEPFINEVVILSQINHRNIVRLLGCCLETEVPLLVYEYIANGNLFQFIRDQNQEFPLTWKKRLQIATEVAGALVYLHSSTSIPIYHRDIKSTNILLDEMFRAKLADFGTSRSIAIEQTHLTTVVQGTFGYLDPEYFQSSQFTDKSDVYSYGVVLVELLTGQKAISSSESEEEERSLATRFILYMEEMRVLDLMDARVKEEGKEADIIAVAGIAKRCLNLSGKKRPTMKQVMTELERITTRSGSNENENEDSIILGDEEQCYLDYSSSMKLSCSNLTFSTSNTFAASDDEEALLIKII